MAVTRMSVKRGPPHQLGSGRHTSRPRRPPDRGRGGCGAQHDPEAEADLSRRTRTLAGLRAIPVRLRRRRTGRSSIGNRAPRVIRKAKRYGGTAVAVAILCLAMASVAAEPVRHAGSTA